jgi:hypothetical protein
VRLLPRLGRITVGPVTYELPGPTGPTGPAAVEDELERARKRNAKTDSRLREFLGFGALLFAGAQFVVADVAFYKYGIHYHWKIPPEAIIGWLGATVIQVVGIVLVIAKYLFPEGGSTN